MTGLRIEVVTAPTEAVRLLVGELEAELAAAYPPEQRHGLPLQAIFQPHIRFLVATIDGEPVACGGVALLGGFAELKRMYARPAVRGRGVMSAVLRRLERIAEEAGFARLTLETGDAQGAALRFYAREGFRPCAAFGPYRSMPPSAISTSVFMEKSLAMDATRDAAVSSALRFFDDGGFEARLGELVAIRSTSQDPGHEADLALYLQTITPWLERLGFRCETLPNPVAGGGPILLAERMEPEGPTVITYGHGDTVRGLEDQWEAGRDPWTLQRDGDRWYGRGSADNKGQHVLNLSALEHVLQARGGRLGYSVKLIIETGEEAGSKGLSELVAAHKERLAADVLLASDGPRAHSTVPTLSTGTRGSFHFDLIVDVRPGGVHSGNWGGMTTDPAIVLAHAIASIADRHGKILVRDWVPSGISNSVRDVLRDCELRAEGEAATIDPGWGEPGLSAAEKVYAWTSFIVLAMLSGRPENPVNAVAPNASAHCQIRYTVDVDPYRFEAALRAHLDEHGFGEVQIRPYGIRMPARRSDPSSKWVKWAVESMERTLGKRVQVIPNSGGGLPNDVFMDHLGTQLLWVPHSYNGCKQHGPNEHFLIAPAREGMAAMAGLWWDLGDGAPTA